MSTKKLTSKFAFILHADVVGSTGLVQEHEVLAHERIQDAFRRFCKFIESYNGFANEVRGDALVAEFNKASDALAAALLFQRENAEFLERIEDPVRPEVRIGIAMGEVIVADNTVTGAGVVLAQRLEQLADPGGVVIHSSVHDAVPARLPYQYEDLGEHDLKGFEAPVRAYAASTTDPEQIPAPDQAAEPTPILRRASRLSVVVILGILVACLGVWSWFVFHAPEIAPGSPSQMQEQTQSHVAIAVLPFKNLSGDPDQEYFSDGISEDIITDLSRISSIAVISRQSSFVFRDTEVPVQQIAAQLKVGHILEGSVRKSDDRLRITAQLVNAESGLSVWAERYDRQVADLFDLQDEIRNSIVEALSIRLVGQEAAHLAHRSTDSFNAYDAFLQGRRAFNQLTKEGMDRAESFYRKAIELDPGFARAYGALGITLVRRLAIDQEAASDLTQKDRALELAQKAVELENTSPQAYWALGFVHMVRFEYESAVKAVETSVALAPNFSDGYGLLALINNQLGRGDQALRYIRKGMALNPGYSWDFPYNMGRALYNLREYEQALEPLLDALERNEYAWNPRLFLAACYVRLGRADDAEWEIDQLMTNHPDVTLSNLNATFSLSEGEHRERLFQDLAEAGLPE